MPRFGKRSKERLKGVNVKLVNVLNDLKKFAKDPIGYVAKKSKCVKAAKAKGLSSKEASAFCKSGSQSKDRLKAATKIKAVPSPKDIRRTKSKNPVEKVLSIKAKRLMREQQSFPEKEVARSIKRKKRKK